MTADSQHLLPAAAVGLVPAFIARAKCPPKVHPLPDQPGQRGGSGERRGRI